jgi:hypothetical protein
MDCLAWSSTRPTPQPHPAQVNLALKDLPRFKCLPERVGQHNTTTHLLPDEAEVVDVISQGFRDVQEGRLPEFPTSEPLRGARGAPESRGPARRPLASAGGCCHCALPSTHVLPPQPYPPPTPTPVQSSGTSTPLSTPVCRSAARPAARPQRALHRPRQGSPARASPRAARPAAPPQRAQHRRRQGSPARASPRATRPAARPQRTQHRRRQGSPARASPRAARNPCRAPTQPCPKPHPPTVRTSPPPPRPRHPTAGQGRPPQQRAVCAVGALRAAGHHVGGGGGALRRQAAGHLRALRAG